VPENSRGARAAIIGASRTVSHTNNTTPEEDLAMLTTKAPGVLSP